MPKEDRELERKAILPKLAAGTAQVERCASVSGFRSVMVHLNFASNIINAKDYIVNHYGVCNEPSNRTPTKILLNSQEIYAGKCSHCKTISPRKIIQEALLNSQSKLNPSEEYDSRLGTSAMIIGQKDIAC